MYRFTNDYSEAAHPAILQAIAETSCEGNFGYGCDEHTARAAALVREVCAAPDALVQFLVGGTQTNLLAAAAFLRPHEAIIAAQSGHVCVHETGAIEATGHKCVAMPAEDGRLTPAAIRAAVEQHPDEHMVKPRMVYISNTTEVGTVYTTAQLEEIRAVCDELDLLLYLDGARLGCALAAQPDVSLPFLARVCDAFYIGGTKNGALFGEALVFTDPALCRGFDYLRKQRGGLLAKGRLLGAQFEALFTDGLYTQLGAHANAMARRLQDGILAAGYPLLAPSATNQVFPVLPKALVEFLETRYVFRRWGVPEDPEQVPIRLVTAFTTTPEAVDALIADLAYVG